MAEDRRVEIVVAHRVPGIIKAGLYGVIGAGIYLSFGNWISLVGYVLAAFILWVYILMEGTAVEYFNKFTLLKTMIEVRVLEETGTKFNLDSLTPSEEQNGNDSSTK